MSQSASVSLSDNLITVQRNFCFPIPRIVLLLSVHPSFSQPDLLPPQTICMHLITIEHPLAGFDLSRGEDGTRLGTIHICKH